MSDAPSTPVPRLPLIDARVRLSDGPGVVHGVQPSEMAVLHAFVGETDELPRSYSAADYLAESAACDVQGVVLHESLAVAGLRGGRRRDSLLPGSSVPVAVVAQVDFLDRGLEEQLEAYRSLPNIAGVCERMGWDANDRRRRFARRPDLLGDAGWRQGLESLRQHDFRCELEVFSPQLPELLELVRLHPETGFTLAAIGWPLDLGRNGFARWKQDIGRLARCDNVRADISSIECIFGPAWTVEEVGPWVLSLIDHFSPERCMIGSHMPFARLSGGFDSFYARLRRIVADFSADEQDLLFRRVAADWFHLPLRPTRPDVAAARA